MEFVFSRRVRAEGIRMTRVYDNLVDEEEKRIARFSAELEKIAGCRYVDVAAVLQEAAFGSPPIYRSSADGHPVAAGYNVIARALSHALGGPTDP